MTKDWGGPKVEGRDSFTPEGSGGRGGFAPEGLGISDLMSSEYDRRLSRGRIPEGRTTKAKLETSHDFQRLNPINANRNSRRFSRAVQTVGMLSVSSRSTGLYSQLRLLVKK